MDSEEKRKNLEKKFERDFSNGPLTLSEYLDIWKRLGQVFRKTFDDESLVITPEMTAEDIEDWDSLTNIQLIVAIEKEFPGLRFKTGEIAGLADVGDMVNVVVNEFHKKTRESLLE